MHATSAIRWTMCAMGKTYRRKSDGALWRHVGTYAACWAPIEMRGAFETIYLTRSEFYDEYEEVVDD